MVEILANIAIGMIFGAIMVPIAFAAFLLTIFILGAIAYGLFLLGIQIYIKVKNN